MAYEFFDPVLLVREGLPTPIDLRKTPFFCNIGGYPNYLAKVPHGIEIIPRAHSDEVIGKQHKVLSTATTHPDNVFGDQTRLEFDCQRVEFEAILATPRTAAAFGMTLIEPGQAVHINSPQPLLSVTQFEYSMFAGHKSPYEGTNARITSKVCTDLECHDFPHLFTSTDPSLPRVTSVARYWPEKKTIFLADLWVPRGKALYIPPRPLDTPFIDLHCSRNSALACWHGTGPTSLQTQTLLQTQDLHIHWFWNELPTTHPLLDLKGVPHA